MSNIKFYYKLERVDSKCHQRQQDLEEMIQKLNSFEDDIQQLHANLDQLLDTLNDQLPVAGDIQTIKQQLEEFKVNLAICKI